MQAPGLYRSKDYIVVKLKAGDTPASLARRFLGDAGLAWQIEQANPRSSLTAGRFIRIPARPIGLGGLSDRGYHKVPILCYHRFGNSCKSPLCVPENIFDQQMRYLHDNGFHVIGPNQLLGFLQYKKPLPKKSVMITVDDGYRSFYSVAYPILKKYGFTATLFIYTDYVGVSSKAITWRQLRELKKAGFTIGSHTIAHSDLSKQGKDETDNAYRQRLKTEIYKSKQILDAKLKQDTMFFAYPFGRHNHVALRMAHQAGYKMAVTVKRGSNPFFIDPYAIHRDQILKRNMATFKSRLKTFQPLSLR